MPKGVKVLAHKVIKAGQAVVYPQKNVGGEGTLLTSEAGGVPTPINSNPEKTPAPPNLPESATSVAQPDASHFILLASEHILSSSLPLSMVDQLPLGKVRSIPGIHKPHKPIFLGMTQDTKNLENCHVVKAMLRKLKDRGVQRDSKGNSLKDIKVSLPRLSPFGSLKHLTEADRVADVVAGSGYQKSENAIWQSSGQVTKRIGVTDILEECCKRLSKGWFAYLLRYYFEAWLLFCKEEDLERNMILEIMCKIEEAKANLPNSNSFGGSRGSIDQNMIAKVLQRQIQGTADCLGSSNRNKNTVSTLVNNLEAPARFHDFCLAVTKGTLPNLDIIQNGEGEEQGLNSPRQPAIKAEEEHHGMHTGLMELLDTSQKLNFEHIDPKVSRPESIFNMHSGTAFCLSVNYSNCFVHMLTFAFAFAVIQNTESCSDI